MFKLKLKPLTFNVSANRPLKIIHKSTIDQLDE